MVRRHESVHGLITTSMAWTSIGFIILLLVWLVFSFFFNAGPSRVASPYETIQNLFLLLVNVDFQKDIALSVQRVALGFGLAALLGSALGWLTGVSQRARFLLVPLGSFLRYIPPLALVPLLILYLGIGEQFKMSVVFFGVFFFILQMTIDSVSRINVHYWDLAYIQKLNWFQKLRFLVIPATLEETIDTWRINLAGAWTFVVAAEIVGAEGGIGHFIFHARRFGNIEDVYASILLFGFIGLFSDYLLDLLKKLLIRWS